MSIDDNSYIWSPNPVSCISDLLEGVKTYGYLYTKLTAYFFLIGTDCIKFGTVPGRLWTFHVWRIWKDHENFGNGYSNKFTQGLMIYDDTPMARLDCFKIPVWRVTIYNLLHWSETKCGHSQLSWTEVNKIKGNKWSIPNEGDVQQKLSSDQ